jgi:hypothetical protein
VLLVLADIRAIFRECGQKAVPAVRGYPVIAYSQPVYPFFQFQRRFQVPLPPYSEPLVLRRYFPGGAVIGVNEPYSVLFFTHVGPQLVYFQAVIVVLFRFYLVFC